jgi:hypothetical protein
VQDGPRIPAQQLALGPIGEAGRGEALSGEEPLRPRIREETSCQFDRRQRRQLAVDPQLPGAVTEARPNQT